MHINRFIIFQQLANIMNYLMIVSSKATITSHDRAAVQYNTWIIHIKWIYEWIPLNIKSVFNLKMVTKKVHRTNLHSLKNTFCALLRVSSLHYKDFGCEMQHICPSFFPSSKSLQLPASTLTSHRVDDKMTRHVGLSVPLIAALAPGQDRGRSPPEPRGHIEDVTIWLPPSLWCPSAESAFLAH